MPAHDPLAERSLNAIRPEVDALLVTFLTERSQELADMDPSAALLGNEMRRMVDAGGKRLRPALCYWGHIAAGGEHTDAIVQVAASLELLHTFALIHDDVMDGSPERRGVAAAHAHLAWFARQRAMPVDPERFGISAAVLVGDLAAVFADELFWGSGFDRDRLSVAFRRYNRMRIQMAAGQLLDIEGVARVDERSARRVAMLKTGTYTVEGPLQIGALLADASLGTLACLERYGGPLGEAFQLRDDLLDAAEDEPSATGDPLLVDDLVDEAVHALDPAVLVPDAVDALVAIAALVRTR